MNAPFSSRDPRPDWMAPPVECAVCLHPQIPRRRMEGNVHTTSRWWWIIPPHWAYEGARIMCTGSYRVIGPVVQRNMLLCKEIGKGFCPASVDGYCIGGRHTGECYG